MPRESNHVVPIIVTLGLCLSASAVLAQASGDSLPAGALVRFGAPPPRDVGSILAVAFAPDGKTLITCGERLCVWEVATGKRLRELDLKTTNNDLLRVVIARDGQLALVGRSDKLTAWETASVKEVWSIEIPKPPKLAKFSQFGFINLALSPDKRIVATTSLEEAGFVIRFWDGANGKGLGAIMPRDRKDQVVALAFSPGSNTMAALYGPPKSTAARRVVRLYDVPSWQEIRTLEIPVKWKLISSLHWFPDGKSVLIGGDGVIQLDATRGLELKWPVRSEARTPLVLHEGERGSFARAAFSPDGRMLATSGQDQTIRLWELATGRAWHRSPQDSTVTALAFTPDGRALASACADKGLITWDITGRARAKPVKLAAQQLEALWSQLGDDDPAKAWSAVWALDAATDQALALLQKRVQPAAEVEGQRLRQWIQDLDAQEFAVREKATQAIEKLGKSGEKALLALDLDKLPLEARRRVEQLLTVLAKSKQTQEELRQLRAVAALEHIGSAAAQEVLKRLANGDADALLTHDARNSLQRLEKRRQLEK